MHCVNVKYTAFNIEHAGKGLQLVPSEDVLQKMCQ